MDRDYAAFVDLVRYLQPSKEQLDDFQDGIVLYPLGILDDDNLFDAFSRTKDSDNDRL